MRITHVTIGLEVDEVCWQQEGDDTENLLNINNVINKSLVL